MTPQKASVGVEKVTSCCHYGDESPAPGSRVEWDYGNDRNMVVVH